MGRNFYIYFHINIDKGEVFYVGKGTDKRAWHKSRRSRFWHNITKKYNYIVVIVEKELLENEAFELEMFYINKIGRRDLGLGPLVNMTDGGNGSSGRKLSKETRIKIGNLKKGTKTSEETKKKISMSKKGNTFFSEESRLKMSEAKKKQNKNKR